MEWLALLLLAAALIVPVVLLLGFAGCDIFFPLNPPPELQQTFATDLPSEEDFPDVTLVQRIESVRLSDSGSQVQLTIKALTQAVVINRILISQAAGAGNLYDSADDLTDVASGVLVDANSSVTLPAVVYNLDRTKPLLIAMDIPAQSGRLPFLQGVPPTDAVAFFRNGVAEAAINVRQNNYNLRNRIYLVERIDVQP
jgi:hypothetical protein